MKIMSFWKKNFFIPGLLLILFSNKLDSTIYEFHLDLFPTIEIPTEFNAYKCLKDKPIPGVNYLAIPWYRIVNKNRFYLVPNIKINGGFTVCQHIGFRRIIPFLKKMGIDRLFAVHAKRGETFQGIRILPFPHAAAYEVCPAEKKDIWYSFIGKATHAVRSKIFKMSVYPNTIIKERKSWHWASGKDPKVLEAEAAEYCDILSRSRFSLCPRGTGPNTARFWESLFAGAIPILIADDLLLPDGFDWDSCIIRVAEKDIEKINQILSQISAEREELMRENCSLCYEQFSGVNFANTIRRHYKQMS